MFPLHEYPLSQAWLSWIAIGAFVAGVVRGLTGFGSAMVLFPLLSLAVGPVVAAPIMQALDYVCAIPLLPKAWRHCRWAEVIPLSVGAIALIPVGVALLMYVDGNLLRRATAVVLLLVVGAMALGWRYRGKPHVATSLGVGALSGLMGGATTLTGPPVALFWLGGQSNSEQARSSIIVFFAIAEFATLVAYALGGLFTPHVLITTVVLVVPFGVGLLVGTKVFGVASERVFRTVALATIALVAVVSLLK